MIRYNKDEKEILYNRNSRFIVKEIELKNNVYHILLEEKMNKDKLFSSYRWNEPIKTILAGEQKQTKEERIKSKKKLLKILVENKTLTQEEANKRLEEFIKNLK